MSEVTSNLPMRHRPSRFDELLGQEAVTTGLRADVAKRILRRAYLFVGPSGTGKTTAARVLAAAVNCDSPQNGEPCGTCSDCAAMFGPARDAVSWYTEVSCAAATNRGDLEDLFEHRDLGSQVRHRVYVLDEAHALAVAAQSYLLKILEEEHSTFLVILCTTRPDGLLLELTPRAHPIPFESVSEDLLAGLVHSIGEREGHNLSDPEARAMAARAAGSPRQALGLLDQYLQGGEVQQPVGESILLALLEGDTYGLLSRLRRAEDQGALRPREVLDLVRTFYRDVLAYRPDSGVRIRSADSLRAQVQQASETLSVEEILRRLTVLLEARLPDGGGVAAVSALEGTLIQASAPSDWDRHTEVIRRLGAVEAQLRRLADDQEVI